MILSVKKLFYRTIDSIKDFNKNHINNFGFLIPIAMSLTSIISAVVGYIIFIAKGGYSTQFLHIKQSGIDGITKSFTTGTSGFLTGGIVLKIVFFLFLAQLVVMLIAYFRESEKAKKILMIIDLSLFAIVIIASVVIFLIANGSIEAYQNQLVLNIKTIKTIYCILALLALVIFIVLVLISKCRWMLGYSVLCLALNFIVMPLIMLLIENIIPLVLGIIVLVFIAGMIYLIFKVILSENSEGSFSTASDSSTNMNEINDKIEQKGKAGEPVKEENSIYIQDLNKFLGIKLYKVHGIFHDYVESDNGIGTRELCSVEQLDKGKFHIYDSKSSREVQPHEIPWRKQD